MVEPLSVDKQLSLVFELCCDHWKYQLDYDSRCNHYHELRKNVIIRTLTELGVAFHIQTGLNGQRPHNIICQTGTFDQLLIGTHYDVHPECVGANKNTASVVQLLAAAGRFSKHKNMTICFWDLGEPGNWNIPTHATSEETGAERLKESTWLDTMGSAVYANNLSVSSRSSIKQAVVLEITGRGNLLCCSNISDPKSVYKLRGTIGSIPVVSTKFGDGRGLSTNKIPSATICLVPSSQLSALNNPAIWKDIYTLADSPNTIERQAMIIMARILDGLISKYAIKETV